MRLEQLSTALCHAGWVTSCLPDYIAFRRSLYRPEHTQKTLLAKILHTNANSKYGRRYGFSKLRSVCDYQTAVPISTYDDIEPQIERIKNGEKQVLTSESVRILEKTSGSTAAAKYIPYTRTLLREFQHAVNAWMVDLYAHHPSMLRGKAYWVITPLTREPEITRGGIPVGLQSDMEYFGGFARFLLNRILVAPQEAAKIDNFDVCLDTTAHHLARCRSLTFISVWNPSFLSLLMERLHGNCSVKKLWPKLEVISCWADASARQILPELRSLFRGVTIQGKGLLATEGVVSIPLMSCHGAVLAVKSHFFEFLDQDDGSVRLSHELEEGRSYSVLLTTGGGLYRYRLGDLVRVTGFVEKTPLLEFIGKEEGVSDLCGEKLNPIFVGRVLDQLRTQGLWSGRFGMLAPLSATPPYYAFFLEAEYYDTKLSELLDLALRENPQYDYCRRLGQLAAPRLFLIRHGSHETYLRRCESLGQRAGSVKPTPLHTLSGWDVLFDGEFEAPVACSEKNARMSPGT